MFSGTWGRGEGEGCVVGLNCYRSKGEEEDNCPMGCVGWWVGLSSLCANALTKSSCHALDHQEAHEEGRGEEDGRRWLMF